MDIYLLRDGQQTGPFTEPAVQTQLRDGDITLDDFAWRDGLENWQPLHAVLYPKSATQKILPPPPAGAPTPTPEPFLSPALAKPEPASPQQKAFLTYLGIAFAGELSRERAAELLREAGNDPKNAARTTRWEVEKLRLHPDLFADEIQARKEYRSTHFLELCRTEGAALFHDVTKAHAQVLVGYLDVQHPNWDDHADAVRYFFAAVAEKFPQLVKSGARGQIKYPDGPKVAAEMERSGLAVRRRPKRSPIAAALRGLGIGIVLLAALYGAAQFYEQHVKKAQHGEDSAAVVPDVPLPTPPGAGAEPKPKMAESLPDRADKPDQPAPVVPSAATASTETPPPAATPATPAEPAAMAAATPAPSPTTPAPAAPAAIPGAEAPAAIPPMANATPAPAPSLLDGAPAPAAPPAPATPAPRTSVKITKATAVALRFGTSTLAAGTVVPLVSSDGVNAVVRFGTDVIYVPIANTDLNAP